MNSAIPRFYRLPLHERRVKVGDTCALTDGDLARLAPESGLREGEADRMVENAIGVFGLPLGLCVNLRVDGEDVLVPMAVEEPSVVAACSFAATTEGSSTAIGTSTSSPSTRRFTQRPRGRPKTPIAFSTMRSASPSRRPLSGARRARSPSVSAHVSPTLTRRSCRGSR